MMNDQNQAEAPRDESTKEKDKRKWLLLLLLLLLILAVVAYFCIFGRGREDEQAVTQEPPVDQLVEQPTGERFEFSEFYHSDGGEWIIRDEGILVLKERKFISASEKDAYTVHEVKPGERVKILEADQRWKQVMVQPDGLKKPVIVGWLDANNVRNADQVEPDTPTTAPKSNKAMKQKYPH
jgi:hypothetical protein